MKNVTTADSQNFVYKACLTTFVNEYNICMLCIIIQRLLSLYEFQCDFLTNSISSKNQVCRWVCNDFSYGLKFHTLYIHYSNDTIFLIVWILLLLIYSKSLFLIENSLSSTYSVSFNTSQTCHTITMSVCTFLIPSLWYNKSENDNCKVTSLELGLVIVT